jgi:hypothetical protein
MKPPRQVLFLSFAFALSELYFPCCCFPWKVSCLLIEILVMIMMMLILPLYVCGVTETGQIKCSSH